LTGEPRVTVGSPDVLLHSRIAPAEPSSKPDPVTLTPVPPFRHVPGSTVRLGPEPVDVDDFGVQGTVDVVLGCVVVVVVLVLVVVVVLAVVDVVVVPPPPVVVVVVVPVPCPLNVIGTGVGVVLSPETPKSITHEKPSAICAAVGGQGYLAASLAAGFPSESVIADGGPITPVATVKVADRFPLASVVSKVRNGSVHDTGMALPAKVTVACGVASLHSSTAPLALAG
jgi:hypothetical protein